MDIRVTVEDGAVTDALSTRLEQCVFFGMQTETFI